MSRSTKTQKKAANKNYLTRPSSVSWRLCVLVLAYTRYGICEILYLAKGRSASTAFRYYIDRMQPTPDSAERLAKLVDQLKIRNVRRHIFLCADQTKPVCAVKEEGLASWEYLKKRLEELGLTKADND